MESRQEIVEAMMKDFKEAHHTSLTHEEGVRIYGPDYGQGAHAEGKNPNLFINEVAMPMAKLQAVDEEEVNK